MHINQYSLKGILSFYKCPKLSFLIFQLFFICFKAWKVNPLHMFMVFHGIRQNKLGTNQQNCTEIVKFKQMKHFCIFYFNQNLFRWISNWCWFVLFMICCFFVFSFFAHCASGPDPASPVLRKNLPLTSLERICLLVNIFKRWFWTSRLLVSVFRCPTVPWFLKMLNSSLLNCTTIMWLKDRLSKYLCALVNLAL